MDQRRIRDRIASLRVQLAELAQSRRQKRRQRERRRIPTVALVGYTNAGKSSLLNALTGANALVQDQLFSTLDPTTRRLGLPEGRLVLLSDTVGFVRDLPHQLVEAFRSTLEEAAESDLLLHVVDVAAAEARERVDVVREVLGEIGAGLVPEVLVANKADVASEARLAGFGGAYPDGVVVSARTGQGLEELAARVGDETARLFAEVELLVPFGDGRVVASVHERGEVLQEEYRESGTWLRARLPAAELRRVEDFLLNDASAHPESG